MRIDEPLNRQANTCREHPEHPSIILGPAVDKARKTCDARANPEPASKHSTASVDKFIACYQWVFEDGYEAHVGVAYQNRIIFYHPVWCALRTESTRPVDCKTFLLEALEEPAANRLWLQSLSLGQRNAPERVCPDASPACLARMLSSIAYISFSFDTTFRHYGIHGHNEAATAAVSTALAYAVLCRAALWYAVLLEYMCAGSILHRFGLIDSQ